MTGVLRELAANPRDFARNFSFTKGAVEDPAGGFEMPQQAAPGAADDRDDGLTRADQALASALKRARVARSRQGGQREAVVVSPLSVGSDDEIPIYFRRRDEALPGTYNRAGRVTSLSRQPPAQADATSSSVSGEPVISQMTPAEQGSRAREALIEEQQRVRDEPPRMGRAAAAAGEPRSLTAADEAVIRNLKRLEQQLMGREIEQARVSGGVIGVPRHVVETGPDGERYVTGGAVSPSIVRGGTAEQELVRASATRRAALAPSSRSSRDLAVASAAARLERAAEQEIENKTQESQQEDGPAAQVELSSARSFADLTALAASRREQLRADDERGAAERADARASLQVAAVSDVTVPNAEVVTLQREVAIDAYLTQI